MSSDIIARHGHSGYEIEQFDSKMVMSIVRTRKPPYVVETALEINDKGYHNRKNMSDNGVRACECVVRETYENGKRGWMQNASKTYMYVENTW